MLLDDLAADNSLDALDGDTGAVLGLYLNSGQLVLQNPSTPDSGTVRRWLDPWDRVYRYQRTTNAGTNSGVRTDGGGSCQQGQLNGTGLINDRLVGLSIRRLR